MCNKRMMSTFLLLLIVVGFSAAQVTDKPLLKPSDNPSLATWIVVGVIASTTMSVLIILIPTILYYKYLNWKESEGGILKK